jgi:hypothetical protein
MGNLLGERLCLPRNSDIVTGRAVRGAERVRPGEHDEVLEVEALGREDLGEQRDVSEGRRKLVGSLRGMGHRAIAPPECDGPERALGENDDVAGYEGEHVGAGDGVGAGGLDLGFHPVHGTEAPEALVRVGVLLG